MIKTYLEYLKTVRRYSPRTLEIYAAVLEEFSSHSLKEGSDVASIMESRCVRNYEVYLLDEKKLDARSVNLHLSVISGFAKFLIKRGVISTNPVSAVSRPKMESRLPVFCRKEAMEQYFRQTKADALEENLSLICGDDKLSKEIYERRMKRLIISVLFSTGLRRSELISLKMSSFDRARRVLRVRGKGDKMREIPLILSLCEEIFLYLQARELIGAAADRGADSPLIVSAKGTALYPMLVDRIVKEELGGIEGITGRKSPHVLRHTIATELLDEGADLNSIKELLGHSSLAATQVYTHNSIEKLRTVYTNAHPRAKNGGKNGD